MSRIKRGSVLTCALICITILVPSLISPCSNPEHGQQLIVAEAYYLPGTVPVAYAVGNDLRVKVNSLSSERTQLPYDFYSLPFCHPANHTKIKEYPENVGEIMLGDKIETSPYLFKMMQEQKVPLSRTMKHDLTLKSIKHSIVKSN